MNKQLMYSRPQLWALVLLRFAIGWHFLYEGVSKLMSPSWSALPYLNDSQGVFSSLFHSLAANPTTLSAVNALNTYGLILVGLTLILGLCSKYSSFGAIIFLVLYYMSHPQFVGVQYMMPPEGSYLWIDKNIIEICALIVLVVFPTSHRIGLDSFLCRKCNKGK